MNATGHRPERTCVVCRRRYAKTELFRFVKEDGLLLAFDPMQRRAGRGYYLCTAGCIQRWHDARLKKSRKGMLFKGFTAAAREQLERRGLLRKEPTQHV